MEQRICVYFNEHIHITDLNADYLVIIWDLNNFAITDSVFNGVAETEDIFKNVVFCMGYFLSTTIIMNLLSYMTFMPFVAKYLYYIMLSKIY